MTAQREIGKGGGGRGRREISQRSSEKDNASRLAGSHLAVTHNARGGLGIQVAKRQRFGRHTTQAGGKAPKGLDCFEGFGIAGSGMVQ